MRHDDNSGIILIVVLWILVILSALAIGLSRRVGVELALSKNAVGKMRSKYIALSGLAFAVDQIKQDQEDSISKKYDTRYECGFRLEEGKSPEDLLKGVEVGDGYFDVRFLQVDETGSKVYQYGLRDEESKVNVNTLTIKKYGVLKELFLQSGYDENLSESLAKSILKLRKDGDSSSDRGSFGSIEEIALAEGMNEEVFEKVKEFITVFPKKGKHLVNIDTAEKPVLISFAKGFVGGSTNAAEEDAESLIDKLLLYRQGDDGVWPSEDDRIIDFSKLLLNSKEKVIAVNIDNNRKRNSRYFNVKVRGVDLRSSVVTDLGVIVSGAKGTIVSWQRN